MGSGLCAVLEAVSGSDYPWAASPRPSYRDLPGRIPSSGGGTGQGDGETDGSAAGSSLAVK